MNTITTHLDYYTYDSSEYSEGPRPIRWWVLEKDNEGYGNGRVFTQDEEKAFINFILQNGKNFVPDSTNVYLSHNEHAPSIDIYDTMSQKGVHPHTVVLREIPTPYNGQRFPVMDIRLWPNHTYNLPFDVIGVFE